MSFDSLHRNSGGNSNKQTGQPGRGENVKQRPEYHRCRRRDLLTACQELNSLLSFLFSHICFSGSSTSPHCLSSRRLVHTTCFPDSIFPAGSKRQALVVGDETCLGLRSINRAGRAAVIMASQKFAFWDTLSLSGAVIRAGEMRKARRGALHWLPMPARLCRRCG